MKLLYLLFLISVCQAGFDTQKYAKHLERIENQKREEAIIMSVSARSTKGAYGVPGAPKMSGATLISGANYPWIVNIIEISADVGGLKKHGPAAIVSAKYALVNAVTTDNINNAQNVLIVSKSDTIGTYIGPNILIRRAVESILNFDSDIGFKMALLIFCPRIHNTSFWAPLPKAPQTYAPGSPMDIYNYIDGFAKASTYVGPHSDCSSYLGPASYDPAYAFCTTATGTVRINAGDYNGAIVVIDGIFVGINVDRGYRGEFMINVSQFLPWLQSQINTLD